MIRQFPLAPWHFSLTELISLYLIFFGMNLQINLCILAACNAAASSRGNPGGEVLGLVPALLAAGVQQLILPLWPVPDIETSRLMIRFHQVYNAPKVSDPSISLQQAQREFFSGEIECNSEGVNAVRDRHSYTRNSRDVKLSVDNDLKHPFYWGGFIFVGLPKAFSSNYLAIINPQ